MSEMLSARHREILLKASTVFHYSQEGCRPDIFLTVVGEFDRN